MEDLEQKIRQSTATDAQAAYQELGLKKPKGERTVTFHQFSRVWTRVKSNPEPTPAPVVEKPAKPAKEPKE